MEIKKLLEDLLKKDYTLSSMESLTGGLFASTFTSIPGASKVFKGSAVTYTDEVKEKYGVRKSTIETQGAVSLACAKEMALRSSSFFDTDVSVSFTGNAGPTESENKPVGLVFIAIRIQDILYSYELHLEGTRDEIRRQCVDFAFKTIDSKINGTTLLKEENVEQNNPLSSDNEKTSETSINTAEINSENKEETTADHQKEDNFTEENNPND